MNYTILEKTEKSYKVQFNDCKHILYVKKEHYETGQFCCNECSEIWNEEYYYYYKLGLVTKEEKNDLKKEKEKQVKNKKYNISKKNKKIIQNNFGTILSTDMPFQVRNRTYYDLSDLKDVCCVYAIHNLKDHKRYIGSTRDIHRRILQYYNKLKNKTHHCKKLERAYHKYNNNSVFEFEILEIIKNNISDELLYLTEQKYIDFVDGYMSGYNSHPIAGFKGSVREYREMVNGGSVKEVKHEIWGEYN